MFVPVDRLTRVCGGEETLRARSGLLARFRRGRDASDRRGQRDADVKTVRTGHDEIAAGPTGGPVMFDVDDHNDGARRHVIGLPGDGRRVGLVRGGDIGGKVQHDDGAGARAFLFDAAKWRVEGDHGVRRPRVRLPVDDETAVPRHDGRRGDALGAAHVNGGFEVELADDLRGPIWTPGGRDRHLSDGQERLSVAVLECPHRGLRALWISRRDGSPRRGERFSRRRRVDEVAVSTGEASGPRGRLVQPEAARGRVGTDHQADSTVPQRETVEPGIARRGVSQHRHRVRTSSRPRRAPSASSAAATRTR